MKNTILVALASLLVSCGGSTSSKSSATEGSITVDYNSSTSIVDLMESVTAIPLDSKNAALVGENVALQKTDDSFYVADKFNNSLQRFTLQGEFLSKIGNSGRANNEYVNIVDFHVDSLVHIASSVKSTIYDFTLGGEFLGKESRDIPTYSFLKTKSATFFSLGLNNPSTDARLLVVSNDDNRDTLKLLPFESEFSLMNNTFTSFAKVGDTVLFRTPIDPNIYQFCDDTVTPRYTFDFGQYSVDQNLLLDDDSQKIFAELMDPGFADIMFFDENSRHAMVTLAVQTPTAPFLMFGFLNKTNGEGWKWVKANMDEKIWPNAGMCLDLESNFYVMVPSFNLLKEQGVDLSFISNQEALASLDENSNSVILKCKLK